MQIALNRDRILRARQGKERMMKKKEEEQERRRRRAKKKETNDQVERREGETRSEVKCNHRETRNLPLHCDCCTYGQNVPVKQSDHETTKPKPRLIPLLYLSRRINRLLDLHLSLSFAGHCMQAPHLFSYAFVTSLVQTPEMNCLASKPTKKSNKILQKNYR